MTRHPIPDLLPGTLDMLLLKSLSIGVMHGYGIARHIQTLSGDVLKVEEGSLYPALQRLQLQGLVASPDDMIAMKQAAGRPQDLIDVETLDAIKRLRKQLDRH